MGPKYNGKYLHKLVREMLGNKRLHQTLTNVVIPTFDIKCLQPTIFSSYDVSNLFYSLKYRYFIGLVFLSSHLSDIIGLIGSKTRGPCCYR